MKWIVFDTESEARDYSHDEAVARGLGHPDNICQYWWNVRETIDGKWAVQCPDGTETPKLKEA